MIGAREISDGEAAVFLMAWVMGMGMRARRRSGSQREESDVRS